MLTLGTLSNLAVGERIWEDEGKLQANVIAFDTKDSMSFITFMFFLSLGNPVNNSPRILWEECLYRPPALFPVSKANTLLMAQETFLHVSTDRENSPPHLWEGRGPLLMADN